MAKRGRPTIYTRRVVRALVKEAVELNISLRTLCKNKGLSYISVEVAKGRYGMRTGRRTRKVEQKVATA